MKNGRNGTTTVGCGGMGVWLSGRWNGGIEEIEGGTLLGVASRVKDHVGLEKRQMVSCLT